MTHLAWTEKNVELEADYVVVGSGAGGAAAAVTLARGGAHVAVVEAGAWRDPEHYPSSAYGTMRDLFDGWGTLVARGRAFWPVVQARCVGGTTVVNSAICVRTPADVFARWKEERGIGGDALAEILWKHQDRLERELSAEVVPEAARGRSNELAMKGGEAMGYESHYMTRYVKDCIGAGQCFQGCRDRRKQSTNVNYVPEVLERGGDVLSCAPVERVVIEAGRAVAVAGRFQHPRTRRFGGAFKVRARKAVVVAASVTHSPVLLMRSGLRSPALGKYFRAHPGTGVFGIYDEPVDMNVGATQGWASLAFRVDPGLKLETLSLPAEMVAGRLSGGGSQLMERLSRYRHIAMWVHAIRAESVGSISRGLFTGGPSVKYGLDRADMERMRKGIALVARTHFAAGAKRVVPGVYGLPYDLGPEDAKLLDDGPLDPRAYVAILSHLFGGCVMGRDEATSVCDERGRVHGVQGLVVADAAVIPSNLGVNPQHTIMALACHFAELLLAD